MAAWSSSGFKVFKVGSSRASPPHRPLRGWARLPCRHINIQSCCCLVCFERPNPNVCNDLRSQRSRRSDSSDSTCGDVTCRWGWALASSSHCGCLSSGSPREVDAKGWVCQGVGHGRCDDAITMPGDCIEGQDPFLLQSSLAADQSTSFVSTVVACGPLHLLRMRRRAGLVHMLQARPSTQSTPTAPWEVSQKIKASLQPGVHSAQPPTPPSPSPAAPSVTIIWSPSQTTQPMSCTS